MGGGLHTVVFVQNQAFIFYGRGCNSVPTKGLIASTSTSRLTDEVVGTRSPDPTRGCSYQVTVKMSQ